MKGLAVGIVILVVIVVIVIVGINMAKTNAQNATLTNQLNQTYANLNTVETSQAASYAQQYGPAPAGTDLQVINGQEVDVAPGVIQTL